MALRPSVSRPSVVGENLLLPVPYREIVSGSAGHSLIGPWLSLVERLVRDEEVASSNLAGPTKTPTRRSDSGEVRTSVRLPRAQRVDRRSQICRARRRRDNLAGPTKTPTRRSDSGEVRTSVRLPRAQRVDRRSQICRARRRRDNLAGPTKTPTRRSDSGEVRTSVRLPGAQRPRWRSQICRARRRRWCCSGVPAVGARPGVPAVRRATTALVPHADWRPDGVGPTPRR